jgi:hypothetical protein
LPLRPYQERHKGVFKGTSRTAEGAVPTGGGRSDVGLGAPRAPDHLSHEGSRNGAA